ncbi:MAG: Bax inhibitor-1 family protein [Coriobacteriales bacterium]|nr:Bax inhibitor-1 family protein [Coriobacteriales bacterium]
MAKQEVTRRVGGASLISRRAYNGLAFGLVTVSFIVMFFMYSFAQGGGLSHIGFLRNPIIMLIVSLVGTIGGIIAMGVGKSKQSVGISVVGFVVFSLTFSVTMALGLQSRGLPSIMYAFAITGCISGIFFMLGLLFPAFFERVQGVVFTTFLALIVVELVAVFIFHVNQTIFDFAMIGIFCFFLGRDAYVLASDEPTVPNAIMNATAIYVDIANILIRVLDIMDN